MADADHVQSFPSDVFPHYTISLALFDNLKNVEALKNKIISGKIDAALLSSKMICDTFQVLVAATKAIGSLVNQKLKTRNINSEIIFNLSASNNFSTSQIPDLKCHASAANLYLEQISDSLKRFGVSPEDSAVVVVTINDFDGLKIQNVSQYMEAEMKPLELLQRYTDEERMKKIYKITDAELVNSALLDSVVTRIAVKEYAT